VPVENYLGEALGPWTQGYDREITPEAFMAAVEALDAEIVTVQHDRTRLEARRQFGPITYRIGISKASICEEREVTTTEHVLPDALAAREQKGA
jgi:hypothetical protein